MKKTSLILIFTVICLALTACGGGGRSAGPTPVPTVAPSQVPYNEGDVVIEVADTLTKDTFGTPQIPVSITNNGEYNYRVTANSITVNGISSVKKDDGEYTLGEEVNFNVTVEPGQTVESNVVFLVNTWDAMGIDEIKNLEISFTINDEVGYKNFTKTVTKEY